MNQSLPGLFLDEEAEGGILLHVIMYAFGEQVCL